jgi:hypothetical protein
MLHLLSADLGGGTSTIYGKNPKQRRAPGLVKVAKTLDQQGEHFEPPASNRWISVIDRSRRFS